MEIEIISGFLGAGKTTFLNKYLPILKGKIVVIENEFGDIGLDSELITEDIPVQEIRAGCICCSLALDFRQGIRSIAEQYQPDRIVIEPSGLGRLSDIVKACMEAMEKDGVDLSITKLVVIVDAASFEEYADGFGQFYLDQIRSGQLILLSNLDNVTPEEKVRIIEMLHSENPGALIYGEDWRIMDDIALSELLALTENYRHLEDGTVVPAIPADKIFSSVVCTDITEQEEDCIPELSAKLKSGVYGQVIRVKGFIPVTGGKRQHVEVTGSRTEYQELQREGENKIIIIGCDLQEAEIRKLLCQ